MTITQTSAVRNIASFLESAAIRARLIRPEWVSDYEASTRAEQYATSGTAVWVCAATAARDLDLDPVIAHLPEVVKATVNQYSAIDGTFYLRVDGWEYASGRAIYMRVPGAYMFLRSVVAVQMVEVATAA